MPIFPEEVRADPGFRTWGAVKRKMGNFIAIDPDRAGTGLVRIGQGDRVVWDAWAYRPGELHQAASRIRELLSAIASSAETLAVAIGTGDDEESAAEEGALLYRLHRVRERDRTLVKKKHQEAVSRDGALICEVCDFDVSAAYGSYAADCVDVHHVVPLHQAGSTKTRLADLAILCPTCHRVIHRHRPIITPAELRATLKLPPAEATTTVWSHALP